MAGVGVEGEGNGMGDVPGRGRFEVGLRCLPCWVPFSLFVFQIVNERWWRGCSVGVGVGVGV